MMIENCVQLHRHKAIQKQGVGKTYQFDCDIWIKGGGQIFENLLHTHGHTNKQLKRHVTNNPVNRRRKNFQFSYNTDKILNSQQH